MQTPNQAQDQESRLLFHRFLAELNIRKCAIIYLLTLLCMQVCFVFMSFVLV